MDVITYQCIKSLLVKLTYVRNRSHVSGECTGLPWDTLSMWSDPGANPESMEMDEALNGTERTNLFRNGSNLARSRAEHIGGCVRFGAQSSAYTMQATELSICWLFKYLSVIRLRHSKWSTRPRMVPRRLHSTSRLQSQNLYLERLCDLCCYESTYVWSNEYCRFAARYSTRSAHSNKRVNKLSRSMVTTVQWVIKSSTLLSRKNKQRGVAPLRLATTQGTDPQSNMFISYQPQVHRCDSLWAKHYQY